MSRFQYLDDVVTLQLDQSLCTGCGLCMDVCPHGVYQMGEKVVEFAHKDACIECGACQKNCPVDAISVDAGVGCAAAIIIGAIKGTEPCCG